MLRDSLVVVIIRVCYGDRSKRSVDALANLVNRETTMYVRLSRKRVVMLPIRHHLCDVH